MMVDQGTFSRPSARIALRAARVHLRPWEQGDAHMLFDAVRESTASVGRWMDWCRPDYRYEEAVQWIQRCTSGWQRAEAFEFVVLDHAAECVGAAGVNQLNRDHNLANLGYWIRESRQRAGLAVEVVTLLAVFAFRDLRLARVEIVVAADNRPSRRVAEKAGATPEGLARNRLPLHGVPVTAAVHSLVPGDVPGT